VQARSAPGPWGYGYNAFWASVLPVPALDGTSFEIETMMNVRALREGLRIAEVPSFERSRVHGVSNLRTFRDGWRVLRTIVRERLPNRRKGSSWDEPREVATLSSGAVGAPPRPHLVPVLDGFASGQLQLAFDGAAPLPPEADISLLPVGEVPVPHLIAVMESLRPSEDDLASGRQTEVTPEEGSPLAPVGEPVLPQLVPVIDLLRAGPHLAVDGPADASEEESLVYAVGGEA
jgi:hypothetical protein